MGALPLSEIPDSTHQDLQVVNVVLPLPADPLQGLEGHLQSNKIENRDNLLRLAAQVCPVDKYF